MVARNTSVAPPASRHRWAFFTYADNYGDCSRAIEVGKAMANRGNPVRFFIHGGRYEDSIRRAGLDLRVLEPRLTDEQNRILMALDQHRAPVDTPLPFTEHQLRDMVESNISALEEFQPDAAYCGLDLSCFISVQHLRLPMVTFVPTALCPALYDTKLVSFPNAMETNFLVRYCLPGWMKRELIKRSMRGKPMKQSAAVYNRVRALYGLPPIYNYIDLARGDLTLLPDLPELSGLPEEDLPDGYAYTGPVFATLDLEIPAEVDRVFGRRTGLNIFVAMGSSGGADLLRSVVGHLRSVEGHNVVCATTNILDPAELGPPSESFYACRFLPAHRVNERADVAVIHGGQGTVQTAAWAGTPVVGIGMQWEQQANLDGLAQAGMGIRIPIHSVTRRRLLKAVNRVRGPACAKNAERIKALVRARNGTEEAVDRMNAFADEFPPRGDPGNARRTR